ncbi:MAG: threonine-phosphate decarboxylase CobD [Veillonellales bacterium]
MNGKPAFEHGGNLHKAVRLNCLAFDEVLDFSANINPLGLPASIKKTLQAEVDHVIHYPDAEAKALKETISHYYGVKEEYITVGNGAVEILYVLCHMVKPKHVLIPVPAFSEYERSARSAGAVVHYFYMKAQNDFVLPVDQLLPQIAAADILFLGNPNNPTGTLLLREDIEYLLKAAAADNTMVVIDESFLDFLPDDRPFTCRQLVSRYANLIVLHSLTKFYAIPGLRLGFSLAQANLTQLFHSGKDPWNVNLLAQAAGVTALHDKEYQTASKSYMSEAKTAFFSQLQSIPNVRPYQPAVNFILADIRKTGMTAKQFCTRLTKYQILIRDCSNYPGLSSGYIRFAVKQSAQNAILLQALREIIEGGKHD